jgi:hypothetical protein
MAEERGEVLDRPDVAGLGLCAELADGHIVDQALA